jgi:hypothetical protein
MHSSGPGLHSLRARVVALAFIAAAGSACAIHPYHSDAPKVRAGGDDRTSSTVARSDAANRPRGAPLPFTPTLINYPPPVLTPEAVAAGVHGPASVRCVRRADGTLHDCALQQPIPMMDAIILETVATWRFSPTEAGPPTETEVALTVPLVAPAAAPNPNESSAAIAAPKTTLVGNTRAPKAATADRKLEVPNELYTGDPIQATPEALESSRQKLMIVKCVITAEGRLTECRVIKSIGANADKVVLDSLLTRRYTPAMLDGRPIAVEKTFTVRLERPE